MSAAWNVRLGRQAEQDYVEIVQWTLKNFGVGQADIYEETLYSSLQALTGGPEIFGAKVRDEIGFGIRTLHVARLGRKGRHFVVFRVGECQSIEVLRVLHDSMDLLRHLSATNNPLH